MERCSTSGIGQKQVINVCDGTNLGFVTDIEFEICEGKIVALIVGDCTPLGLSKEEQIRIPWCKIKCIGEDVILVEIVINECKCSCRDDGDKKKKKRSFF
ncbi:MAG: YlmC/YmxH family sporulation protein [Clostridia bacterium]|nr:YlmC/YmxH family sporulation protein [Clostridia bacterium]